jgi:carboxyl-terminal processing protease
MKLFRFCITVLGLMSAVPCSTEEFEYETFEQSESETDKNKEKEPEQPFDEVVFEWSRTWAEVMQLVKNKHYKVNAPKKGMAKAINEFLNHLDPHSAFLDPETYTRMLESTSGEFFGIGIVIDNTRKTKDKFLVVVDVISDGPADKVGIEPGDKIIEVDDAILEGMATEEIIAKIKGERKTKVHLKVLREGQPDLLEYTIERDVVKDQSALSFQIKNHDIYYVSLSIFSKNAIDQVRNLLEKGTKQDYRGLIIDLRNNSGGLLDAVVDICGFFVDKGSLVAFTKDKDGNIIEKYHTRTNPIITPHIPIFVLINNYTASAAEILAGCLKMHSVKTEEHTKKKSTPLKVFLVGTQTFGKGSVQEIIPVSNNSAVKITVYLYYLPNGETIQGTGIKPDFDIERSFPPSKQMQWFSKFYGSENKLPNSIKPHGTDTDSLDKKKKDAKKNDDESKPKRWQERAKEMLQKDNQLRATITLINMLHTAEQCCPERTENRTDAIAYLKEMYLGGEELDITEITP